MVASSNNPWKQLSSWAISLRNMRPCGSSSRCQQMRMTQGSMWISGTPSWRSPCKSRCGSTLPRLIPWSTCTRTIALSSCLRRSSGHRVRSDSPMAMILAKSRTNHRRILRSSWRALWMALRENILYCSNTDRIQSFKEVTARSRSQIELRKRQSLSDHSATIKRKFLIKPWVPWTQTKSMTDLNTKTNWTSMTKNTIVRCSRTRRRNSAREGTRLAKVYPVSTSCSIRTQTGEH